MHPIMLTAVTALLASCTATPGSGDESTRVPSEIDAVSYVAIPHPDDEMQAWSLIENTPDTFKVFVIFTRGEATAYCAEPAHDPRTGELPPVPLPEGKHSPSCEAARKEAFFGFLTAMADDDPSLPASFVYEGVQGPFDRRGYRLCRFDGDDCVSDRTAEVYSSSRGSIAWFNLGDADLTAEEVEWALTTVRDNAAAFGIDTSLESRSLIGASYWNHSHPECASYAHDDHRAVHEALWDTDFAVGYQAAATCAADPRASVERHVSMTSFDTAFRVSGEQRIGAHPVHYGWLAADAPGYWPGDYEGQDKVFHRKQSFWVRFGEFEEAAES